MIDNWKFWELGWKWNLWDILQGITEGTWDSSDPDVLRLVRSKTLHQSWTYFDNYFECMIRSLENEKVMVHYDILLSYWIIWKSQLGVHWNEMESEFPDTIKGPMEPCWSSLVYMSIKSWQSTYLSTQTVFSDSLFWSLYFPWGP